MYKNRERINLISKNFWLRFNLFCIIFCYQIFFNNYHKSFSSFEFNIPELFYSYTAFVFNAIQIAYFLFFFIVDQYGTILSFEFFHDRIRVISWSIIDKKWSQMSLNFGPDNFSDRGEIFSHSLMWTAITTHHLSNELYLYNLKLLDSNSCNKY